MTRESERTSGPLEDPGHGTQIHRSRGASDGPEVSPLGKVPAQVDPPPALGLTPGRATVSQLNTAGANGEGLCRPTSSPAPSRACTLLPETKTAQYAALGRRENNNIVYVLIDSFFQQHPHRESGPPAPSLPTFLSGFAFNFLLLFLKW